MLLQCSNPAAVAQSCRSTHKATQGLHWRHASLLLSLPSSPATGCVMTCATLGHTSPVWRGEYTVYARHCNAANRLRLRHHRHLPLRPPRHRLQAASSGLRPSSCAPGVFAAIVAVSLHGHQTPTSPTACKQWGTHASAHPKSQRPAFHHARQWCDFTEFQHLLQRRLRPLTSCQAWQPPAAASGLIAAHWPHGCAAKPVESQVAWLAGTRAVWLAGTRAAKLVSADGAQAAVRHLQLPRLLSTS
jgi:hypothetical protein